MLRHCPLVLALILVLVASAGCGDDPACPCDSAPGTLRVSLTDAPTPIAGVEALHLTLGAVRVHAADEAADDDGGWYDILPDTLTTEERTIDLLEYANGDAFLLGEDLFPAGRYTQIRLVLEKSTVTIDGSVYELTVPSGASSGLKLIHGFEVRSGELTGLVLDFDVGRSLFAAPPGSDNFKLKPVIRVVAEELGGGLEGMVVPLAIDAMVMAVSADLVDTATTYVNGETGGWTIWPLLPGDWSVTAMAPGYLSQTREAVTVVTGESSGPVDFTLEPEVPVTEP